MPDKNDAASQDDEWIVDINVGDCMEIVPNGFETDGQPKFRLRVIPAASTPDVSATQEPNAADHRGPNDTAHRAVHDVVEHLINGRVTDREARRQLGDALDRANKAPAPKSFPTKALNQFTSWKLT
jgi:hypothetical protein